MNNNRSSNTFNKRFSSLLPYLPVVLAVLIMIPRLGSSHFGLFDDGNSILAAQSQSSGEWGVQYDANDGRFRPIYWLAFTLLYRTFGEFPFIFFFVNMLALCISTAAIIGFLRRNKFTPWQAGLAGLFFVLSGPVIENYYTLSKGEWLQILFITISLFIVTFYKTGSSFKRQLLVIGTTAFILFGAFLSKETSIVMFPISMAWFVIGWILMKRTKKDAIGWRGAYIMSVAISAGAFFILRFLATQTDMATRGYTERFSFTIEQIMASALRWAGWIMRDFPYLLMVLLLLVIIVFFIRKIQAYLQFTVELLVWMAAWIIVFLPWNYMNEYYLLPFAFGAACLGGVVLGDLFTWRHPIIRVLSTTAVVLLMISAVNNVTTARIQLAVDSVNAWIMDEFSALPKSATVFINIQLPNEYTDQIERQLASRFNRPDLDIQIFDPADTDTAICAATDCYIVMPFVENQPLLTVRMGVHEPSQKAWNESLVDWMNMNGEWQKIEEHSGSLHMMTVDFPRVFCPVIKTRAFCATPAPFVDTRLFTYGWALYRLITP